MFWWKLFVAASETAAGFSAAWAPAAAQAIPRQFSHRETHRGTGPQSNQLPSHSTADFADGADEPRAFLPLSALSAKSAVKDVFFISSRTISFSRRLRCRSRLSFPPPACAENRGRETIPCS